jgi:hypothetical protein
MQGLPVIDASQEGKSRTMRLRRDLASAGVYAIGLVAALAAVGVAVASCGGDASSEFGTGSGDGDGGAGSSGGFGDGGCVGLACKRASCPGGKKTTLSGTVFDPAGKVPLYNVAVYVPDGDLAPIATGASCLRCGAHGKVLSSALTDTNGKFVLDDVPAETEIPIVIEVGKWRRVVKIPPVRACVDTPLADKEVTRLPRTRAEGDIPRIAIVTGAADPLECLLRKIGIADTEFGAAGSESRIHLYGGYGYDDPGPPAKQYLAASKFAPSLNGGASFDDGQALYSDAAKLAPYDLLLLACEGYYNPDKKPNRQALVDWTAQGGRVFASHWHRYWFHDDTAPSPFPAVGTWVDRAPPTATPADVIDGTVDTSFPKGAALSDWLVAVQASTTPGKLPIREAKHNVDAVDHARATSWITLANPTEGGRTAVEYMSFNTPVGVPAPEQCGRAVYSGLHVSSGDATGKPFPEGCISADLSPQEKALEFMLFDLSSCIQSDTEKPTPPR